MKFYQGPKLGDEKPIGGGKYNADEIGHEAYNFQSINDNLYGYFQPHMKEPYEINLSRIKEGFSGDKLDNVLVIWFATNPVDRGQIVVGWYKNATVFRSFQDAKKLPERNYYGYNILAKTKNCTLLPISKRKYPIGHNLDWTKEGNPGQANAFYLLDKNGEPKDLDNPQNSWIRSVIEYVDNYDGFKISSREEEIEEDIVTSGYSSGDQGFQSDVEVRLMVESYAMDLAKNYYSKKGYDVQDVSANRPYDLLIKNNKESRFIEVKGTQTSGEAIILTKNEVNLSRTEGEKMDLFMVHSIELNKKSIKKGTGTIVVITPWQIKEDNLTPISYTYRLS